MILHLFFYYSEIITNRNHLLTKIKKTRGDHAALAEAGNVGEVAEHEEGEGGKAEEVGREIHLAVFKSILHCTLISRESYSGRGFPGHYFKICLSR